MAKVSSHFSCMLCKQKLNFPPDTGIVDFIILILQFYKNHEICEQAETETNKNKAMETAAKDVVKKGKKNGKK